MVPFTFPLHGFRRAALPLALVLLLLLATAVRAGGERPLVVPSFSGVTLAESQAIARASGELPPLPEWCDGTCVIDVAFFYAPEAIGQTNATAFPDVDTGDPDKPVGPQTVGELHADALAAVSVANVVFRRAGLDAKLRFVGLELDPALTGLGTQDALRHVRGERLAHARSRYGADLAYAITADSGTRCTAVARTAGNSRESARSSAVGALRTLCLGRYTFAGLVGFNLGLLLEPGHSSNSGHAPFVPFGHAYVAENVLGTRYGSLMSSVPYMPWFSTVEPVYGRVLGDADVSDAVRALRYTIPEAAGFSPTAVPGRVENPHGYDCRPSASRACLNERRFDVSARFSTRRVSRALAKRLDADGLGDSGSLFYFFGPDNPEMVVKVVDGCGLNGHWWVFGSAATDLAYEVVIKDLANGGRAIRYRRNAGGVIVGNNGYSTAAGVITDTWAFACGRAAAQAAERRLGAGAPEDHAASEYGQTAVAGFVAAQAAADAGDYGCLGNCLNNWRFRVGVNWHVGDVQGGAGDIPTYGLGDSAVLIYFFEPDNPEMLLKVVDGCGVNGHWWVFGSAATDLRYTVWIYDYATVHRDSDGYVRFERTNVYDHHGGGRITGDNGYSTAAGVISDTSAFPCKQ